MWREPRAIADRRHCLPSQTTKRCHSPRHSDWLPEDRFRNEKQRYRGHFLPEFLPRTLPPSEWFPRPEPSEKSPACQTRNWLRLVEPQEFPFPEELLERRAPRHHPARSPPSYPVQTQATQGRTR